MSSIFLNFGVFFTLLTDFRENYTEQEYKIIPN